MISSRRLAREWALKVLYQMDVGKVSLSEAAESAQDRLRMEFVQRGSRTASGSTAELLCLDYVTSSLVDTLPTVRPAFERAVLGCVERAFAGIPYHQEVLFEKSFKYKFKGVKLQPARLLMPESEQPALIQDGQSPNSAELTEVENARLCAFMADLAANLPQLLDKEMRRTVRGQVAHLFARRAGSVWDTAAAQELLQERIKNNEDAIKKWTKVAQTVRTHTADWLRVAAFTVRLLSLVEERQAEIDSKLIELSSGWKLDRQVAVDRNILRLAALEILFLADIPASASINEAVELAKKFSTAESGRFVNGVLGALAAQVADKPVIRVQAAPLDEVMIEYDTEVMDGIDLNDLDDIGSLAVEEDESDEAEDDGSFDERDE